MSFFEEFKGNKGSSYDMISTSNEEDTIQVTYDDLEFNIKNIDNLTDIMYKISKIISTKNTNWKERVLCLKRIGSIIKSDILKNNEYNRKFISLMYEIRKGLSVQITESRSGITKECCKLLIYLVRYYDFILNDSNSLVNLIEYLIPYFIKQLSVSILIISHNNNIALRCIIKHVPISNKGLNKILNGITNKNAVIRVRCIEYLQIIIEIQNRYNNYLIKLNDNGFKFNIDKSSEYNNNFIKDDNLNLFQIILQIVIHGISDAHSSVRIVARRIVWSLNYIYGNNNKYNNLSNYILNKISTQHNKIILNEKNDYKPLPASIGQGHKVEFGKMKGLISNQTKPTKPRMNDIIYIRCL